MDWGSIITAAVIAAIIATWATWFVFAAMPKLVAKTEAPEKEPCEWFEVESVEELGRKIHAGIVLLNRQARSDKWDDRRKDAFIRASRHIEAAHFEVTRLVRN